MNVWLWILQSGSDRRRRAGSRRTGRRESRRRSAPVQVRERVDDDALAELDVDEQSKRGVVRRPVSHERTRPHRGDHGLASLSVIPGKDRERQALARERLGDGKRPLVVTRERIGTAQVRRLWVVATTRDATLGQVTLPVRRDRRSGSRRDARRGSSGPRPRQREVTDARQRVRIRGGDAARSVVPAVELRQACATGLPPASRPAAPSSRSRRGGTSATGRARAGARTRAAILSSFVMSAPASPIAPRFLPG